MGASAPVSAQHTHELPTDVAPSNWERTIEWELPALPEGFESETIDGIRWEYPRGAQDAIEDLQSDVQHRWVAIEHDLGTTIDRDVVIRVARNPEEMRAVAPVGHPPPGYAVGVAYPAFGVILLTLNAPGTWERPNLDQVLTHELSHVMLRRAVNGHPLPRWFVEGVATYQAREYRVSRVRALWSAAVGNDVIPLQELSGRFPARPYEVNLAYAQSADLIRYLRRDETSPRRFRRLIRRLAAGESFPEALDDAYAMSPRLLEREWRADLRDRYRALPLFIGGTTVWIFATLLLLVAYVRQRIHTRRVLSEWEEEEQNEDASLPEVTFYVMEEQEAPPPTSIPPPRAMRGPESEIPTVEYEGDKYTLH